MVFRLNPYPLNKIIGSEITENILQGKLVQLSFKWETLLLVVQGLNSLRNFH